MILAGGIDTTHKVHALNGLGILQMASGHYVDPLAWRQGIHGLGASLTPGLNGTGTDLDTSDAGGSVTGNSILDCACKCGPAQQDQAVMAGLAGLGATTTIPTDWSLTGSALATLAPSLATTIGFAIPNWVLYGAVAVLALKN